MTRLSIEVEVDADEVIDRLAENNYKVVDLDDVDSAIRTVLDCSRNDSDSAVLDAFVDVFVLNNEHLAERLRDDPEYLVCGPDDSQRDRLCSLLSLGSSASSDLILHELAAQVEIDYDTMYQVSKRGIHDTTLGRATFSQLWQEVEARLRQFPQLDIRDNQETSDDS